MARKVMLSISLILVLVAGVWILGCGRVVKPPLKLDNFPHKDGYRWEYKVTMAVGTSEISSLKRIRYFDGARIIPDGLTLQNFIVTDEALSQSAKVFGTISVSGLPLSSPVTYCDIDETGVYSYGSPANPTTEAILLLPLPLEVGKVWQRGDITCEAISEEEVTVPVGTFKAIKVDLGGNGTNESDWYEWYADGAGMVKLYLGGITYTTITGEVIGIIGSGSYTEELLYKNF